MRITLSMAQFSAAAGLTKRFNLFCVVLRRPPTTTTISSTFTLYAFFAQCVGEPKTTTIRPQFNTSPAAAAATGSLQPRVTTEQVKNQNATPTKHALP